MPRKRRSRSQNTGGLHGLENAAPGAANIPQRPTRLPRPGGSGQYVPSTAAAGSQQTTPPVQRTHTASNGQIETSNGNSNRRANVPPQVNAPKTTADDFTLASLAKASAAKQAPNGPKSKPQEEGARAQEALSAEAEPVVASTSESEKQSPVHEEIVQLPSRPYTDIENIPITRDLEALQSLVLPYYVLFKKGYTMHPLSREELERMKRCSGCGKSMSKVKKMDSREEHRGQAIFEYRPPRQVQGGSIYDVRSLYSAMRNGGGQIRQYSQATAQIDVRSAPRMSQQPPQPVLRCKFHSGRLHEKISETPMPQSGVPHVVHVNVRTEKVWSCCSQRPSSDPCSGAEFHVPCVYKRGEIEALWQYHMTPRPSSTADQIRSAVALDCEMGTARSGDTELIRISLVDHFTSEVLIDQLVFPKVPMKHLNTQYSGVTWKDMNLAREQGTCIFGRDSARKKVWDFVGPETIVIGHSLNNDLKVLRWIHEKVVDTFLLEYELDEKLKAEKEAKAKETTVTGEAEMDQDGGVLLDPSKLQGSAGDDNTQGGEKEKEKKGPGKGNGPFSLKTLTRTRLGREIQNKGKEGHDSLEDAVAARDLADWHVKKALGMIEEASA